MDKHFVKNEYYTNKKFLFVFYIIYIINSLHANGTIIQKGVNLKIFKRDNNLFHNNHLSLKDKNQKEKNNIVNFIENDNKLYDDSTNKFKSNDIYEEIAEESSKQYNSHYLSLYRSDLKGNYLESNEKVKEVQFTDKDKCFCNYIDHLCDGEDFCFKAKGAACFHAITIDEDDETKEVEIYHEYGCAPLERGGHGSHFTCNAYRTLSFTKTTIACCYEGNKCNLNITPLDPKINDTHINKNIFDIFYYKNGKSINFLYLGLLIIIILIFTFICFYSLLNVSLTKLKKVSEFQELPTTDTQKPINNNFKRINEKESCNDFTSGSGSLLASLNQRTIALDIRIDKMISKGRYGEVHRATYRGSYVAVKTFYTTVEDSWKNEKEIYLTEMFNHENILQFIAADICSVDSITKMLLITDYHSLGSLYDYLQNHNNLLIREGLSLAMTSACGLEHLHNKILGTGNNKKPEMAHRDIKSKNIIVKRQGVCCLADFGMALKNDGEKYLNNIKIKVGTRRYMAPELLNETLNPKNFECFKQSDIYSFSLVMWEIIRRINGNPSTSSSFLSKNTLKPNYKCNTYNGSGSLISGGSHSSSGYGSTTSSIKTPLLHQNSNKNEINNKNEIISDKINPYFLPYEPWVPSDPSFEHMYEIVCVKKMRPEFSTDWFNENNYILNKLSNLIKECWFENPSSRHTALKIKKDLLKLIEIYDTETLVKKSCHNINSPVLSQTYFETVNQSN
ncbi:Thick veins protein [Strongyloides ratti]|uniref:receptor protein serine/threonine kinase n=1 Tax=Strongyloides ratti TaxID=34506 RepID=A0A090KXG7_STRRB|nr:Thick veins protein [Strongyloides ratti]CEF59958.1 Thick veins protein [Strongyloides ratti]